MKKMFENRANYEILDLKKSIFYFGTKQVNKAEFNKFEIRVFLPLD